MKATCPICGNYGPLESFLAQEDYKKALAVITALPGDLPRQTVRYLAMFRKPGSDRALTGPRALKIVERLRDLANAEQIQWKGNRVYANSPKYWEQAIQVILDRDDQGKIERPLDGHNYLRAIAYEQASKGFEAAHREKEHNANRRAGTSELPSETEPRRDDADRPMSTAEALEKTREHLKGWRERLGGGHE